MVSSWIIIGAIFALFAGVVLAIKALAQDAPPRRKSAPMPATKRPVPDA